MQSTTTSLRSKVGKKLVKISKITERKTLTFSILKHLNGSNGLMIWFRLEVTLTVNIVLAGKAFSSAFDISHILWSPFK